ncbi:tripartite tricarboxylate transporter TctB family protein [Fertoebacter nigrum]|uniref:Tripartite tricarboxylate transporter TctB family protein n=1 Tax=Fertoeibacter niger TaxID=2656921 RepID=A0A8X8KPU2_9RHOB|nr:tripartite tricarboxylate transporter TctB family protein [Fertoeibacter niger]NUB45246.1 tripartite tricarboxylate transporter TctB family protein [Fertoeibacter niger]
MTSQSYDKADAAAGVLFILIGLGFGVQSWWLDIGTALRMGPGYFPLVLSVILVLLGAAVVVNATKQPGEPIGSLAARGMIYILPAPIFFGLTVRGLGFVPSIFLTTFIACFASLKMKPLPALLLSVVVAVFSTLVFSYALGLPFRRFGPWLSF